MKKVLFVATVASHIKAFHLPYLKLLKENGYKVYVAANWNLDEDYKLEYCDEFIQIPIQRSPYSIENIKAVKELKKIINKEKFDIIHCHTPMGSVVARLAAKKTRKIGTKVIYTAHGFHFFKGAALKNWLLFYPVEWYLAKYTDTLITINKEDFERAKSKFNKRCKDIQYIPGVGIDITKFDIKMSDKEKQILRESVGLKKEDFVMIFPAELSKRKGQIWLINALKYLMNEYESIHLLLPGKDSLKCRCQELVKQLNLEKQIHILGLRNDIPNLLKISNLAISSSNQEGLPVNIMEAFAAGLPVVALNCRGMEDLIENGKNGFLVNDCNQKEFVEKILTMYNNKTIYDNISQNNLEKVCNLDISKIICLYKKIYIKGDNKNA